MPQQKMDFETMPATQQLEPIAQVSESATTKPEKMDLKQIVLTQQQLTDIKKDLDKVIESIAENPSMFAATALFWGERPLWQKIVAGIIVIAPTLIFGLVLFHAVLLAISICTLIAAVLIVITLENHYACISNSTTSLKASISGLADMLGVTIQALDLLSQKLTGAIEDFQKENEHLSAQINNLTLQIEQLQGTGKLLEASVEKQRQAVTELAQMKEDFALQQDQFSTQIAELNGIKLALEHEIKQGNAIARTLKAAVEALANTVIRTEDRVAFQERLDDFLRNKEHCLDKLVQRMCDAEHQLLLRNEELKRCNEALILSNETLMRSNQCYQKLNDGHQTLLEQQQLQVSRLEGIDTPIPTQNPKSQATLLRTSGFYATTQENHDVRNGAPINAAVATSR
ncbi:MAG: hypothetical protein ACHP65_07135 [Legionellales bacterium]